jgi:protein TonB
MNMNCLPRTLLLSLLLHCAVFLLFVNFAATERQRPVVVELSLSQLSVGSSGDAMERTTKKGSKAASAAGTQSLPVNAATPQHSKPAAENTPLAKTEEQLPQVAPRPVPTAATVNAQAQQSRDSGPPAGKQAAGSASTPGSAAGEQGKSGRAGGAGQAGSASGTDAGDGNGAGNSPAQLQKKYVSENFAYIMKIIQDHIVYPAKARREGLSGKAFVSFSVLENGQVANIKVLRSTGYELLDQNLIKAITEAAPFPKPPKKAELRMPFTYRLER